jgi:hypothetical protein
MAGYKTLLPACFHLSQFDKEGKNIALFALKEQKIIAEKWLLNFTIKKPRMIYKQQIKLMKRIFIE